MCVYIRPAMEYKTFQRGSGTVGHVLSVLNPSVNSALKREVLWNLQGKYHVVLQGKSHVVLQGKSYVVLQGKSYVVQQGKSYVVLQGKSYVVLQGKSYVVLQGKSYVVLQGKSYVVQSPSYICTLTQYMNTRGHAVIL